MTLAERLFGAPIEDVWPALAATGPRPRHPAAPAGQTQLTLWDTEEAR